MKIEIGQCVTVSTVQGIRITGEVSSILEHTVIVSSGIENYLVSKKELRIQGYFFCKEKKERKTLAFSKNKPV